MNDEQNNDGWVIAGQPDGAVPAVGGFYKVIDSRKGTFFGRILSVAGEWAKVEVLQGKIHWLSTENRMFHPDPQEVNIRVQLVMLVPAPPCFAYGGDGQAEGSAG